MADDSEFAELCKLYINPLLADSAGVIALNARMRLCHSVGATRCADGDPTLSRYAWPPDRDCYRHAHAAPDPSRGRARSPSIFPGVEPQDVHFRMFGSVRELSPAQLACFTQIDYGREMAFILTRSDAAGVAETLECGADRG